MEKVRAIFTPPVFDDITVNARASSLYWIIIALLIACILTLFFPLFFTPTNISWFAIYVIVIGGIVINLVNLLLLHRGAVNFVGAVAILYNWIAFMGVAVKTGGVQSPAYSGIIFISVMAALFLGQGAGFFVIISSAVAGAWMLTLAPDELFLAYFVTRPQVVLIVTLLIAVMATLVTGAATRTIQFSLENIKESEARYRMLIQESPEGILIIDPQGKIILANPGAARLLGFADVNDLIGLSILSMFDLEELNLRPIPTTATFNAGQTIRGERKIIRQEGEQITILGGVRRMPDGNFQFLFQDITDRKLHELEREKMIAELEAKNAELERFAYTVSHDLKTPLITIRSFVGYLRNDLEVGDDERVEADLTYIDEASGTMYQLLDDLLELTRVGRLINEPEWVPYAEIVEEALKLVDGRIRNNQFTIQVDSNLPDVYGDRYRLTQVLQNLIDNSAKFMGDQPDPCIHIGQQRQDGTAIFFVRDNGVGIPPAYHEKIFELFDRLDTSTEGTGIGLSLVKRIVEIHEGEIWIESDGTGRGSTFYFTLELKP